MTEKDWKKYRDAVYKSNIDPELTGKIMVALDNYFKVLRAREIDINRVEGAKAYEFMPGEDNDELEVKIGHVRYCVQEYKSCLLISRYSADGETICISPFKSNSILIR